MDMQVNVAGCTDVGSVRTNNEDNFGYDTSCGIFVVCDGMGGNAAGEVASKIAVDAVLSYFRDGAGRDRPEAVAGAIRFANEAVRQAERREQSYSGMGSTIALVHVPGSRNSICIGHVGDSRVYRIRDGRIELLTSDHSLVMDQVRKGLLTEEQAQRSVVQNVLLQALGSESVSPDLTEVEIAPGDCVLLASDGITRQVPANRILECMTKPAGVDSRCKALIDAARAAGGEDNATCLVLSFQRQSWFRRTFGGGRRQCQNSI